MTNSELSSWPTQQVEKCLQGWKDKLVEYVKNHRRSAIREDKSIISELGAELESRKSKQD